MPIEHVTVICDGGVYEDWETVVVEQDAASNHVNILLSTTEITSVGANTQAAFDKWNFPPGTVIEVYANGDFVARAVVWQYAPSADAEQHSITIHAKAWSYVMGTCSVISPTGGYYEDKTNFELVSEWATPLGVNPIYNLGGDDIVPFWQIRQGATVYAESMRMLKNYGKLLFGMMDGGIAVSDGRAMGAQGPVVQGENIIKMSARLTDENADAELIGQHNVGTDLKQHIQTFGKATSDLANRRVRLITEPAALDNQRAMRRSEWEVRRQTSASLQATVTVPGWHTPAGESFVGSNQPFGREATSSMGPLWMLMADTYIYAPWLKINCVLRATRVVFKQSLAEGSVTELTLVDPASVGMDLGAAAGPSAKCESGSVWTPGFSGGGIGHM